MNRPGVNAYDLYQKGLEKKAMDTRDKMLVKLGHDIEALCNKATGNANSKVVEAKTDLKEWLDSDSQSVLVSVSLFDGADKILDIPIKIDKCEMCTLPELDVLKSKISEIQVTDESSKAAVEKIKARMDGISERLERESKEYWEKISGTKVDELKKDETFNQTAAEVFTVDKNAYPSDWALGQTIPIGGISYVISDDKGGLWTMTRSDLWNKEQK